MDYQVEIKEIEAVRVAYMTHKGLVTEASELFSIVFESINHNINGLPFYIYHEMNPQTFQGVVDVCEATAEEPNNPAVKTKILPSIKVLSVKHIGPYDTVYLAYQAIQKYATENGFTLTDSNREIFVKGPNLEENPQKYITEIVVPFIEMK